MNILRLSPRNNVLSGRKGRSDASRGLGASKLDIPLHTHHPLFPQVDPLSFKDVAEKSQAHHHDDTLKNNGMTESTRRLDTTTATWMDKARSPFQNMQPPDNPYYTTPFRRGVNQFVTTAADQARLLDDSHEKEEEASLGEQIVSPPNADRQHQALSEKITSLDLLALAMLVIMVGQRVATPLPCLLCTVVDKQRSIQIV
jgi:hypothetical protein